MVANKHYRFSFSDNGLRSNNTHFDEVNWYKKPDNEKKRKKPYMHGETNILLRNL